MTPPAQLDLLSDDDSLRPFKLDAVKGNATSYTLFFAVVPGLEDARCIGEVAVDQRSKHHLKGHCLTDERLHITLHTVAHFIDTVPQQVVDAAMAAAARVICPQLPIAFDRVRSFPSSDAFVLLCGIESNASIKHLRQLLNLELRRFDLKPKPTETPHMTMLYDKHKVDEQTIELLSWTATRFALILSHVGAGHHQRIAEWTLLSA